ncbi:MAG: NAD-dependent epimerase/dehydratase family protein [Coriobacteriia bacterium]|nr:NAD-dependent epimerase/dehydratase family protein [Coriobacteriia bacterium]
MRVLVTGGAGFIGSSLVNALVVSGHDAGIIDDLSTGKPENINPAAWFRGLDILDPSMPAAVAEFAPEAVVHLAAQVDVQRSIADPERDRRINVDGTAAVARAAAAAGARRMLSASSAAVYGEPEMLPLPESARKRPENPYGASKLAAETALYEALDGTGVDFASLRFANVYGPRQDWRGEGGVVAIIAAKLAAGERPVIFGDGSQTRDFIFVGDVVGAILAALDSDVALAGELPDGPAYNISTGSRTSVTELVSVLRAVSRVMKESDHLPARPGDILHSALDPAKALATFDWRAAQPLESGIAMTWRWLAAQQR